MGTQCFSATAAHAACAETLTAPCTRSTTHATSQGEVKMAADPAFVTAPRTQEVLMAEVRFGIVFGEMNEVFNGRINKTLLFFTCLAGLLTAGGGVLSILGKTDQSTVLVCTLVLSIVTALAESARRAFKFHERETAYRKAKNEFIDLEAKGWSMNQGTLQKELAKLLKNAPAGGSWLSTLAYNKACREIGHPEVQMEVPSLTRLAASLAT
jgi:hypothetical protein